MIDVTDDAFFYSMDFTDIYNKKVEPPFVPHVDSPTGRPAVNLRSRILSLPSADVRYFETEFISQTPVLTPVHSGTLLPHSHSMIVALMLLLLASPYECYARRIPGFLACRLYLVYI